MFPTIDMRSVYDESQEGFIMQKMAFGMVLVLGLSMIAMPAGGQQGPIMDVPMHPPPPPDTTLSRQQANQNMATPAPLRITVGKKSVEWTPATLAALPHTSFTVYNEHAKVNQTYSGVELISLLAPLGVSEKPHGKDLRYYLVAEGADGYKVVYGVGEITPDVHDATVIVADSLDGKPLAESGPLQLIATGEKRPARWVRNLVNIKVQAAD
jgi:hypothetical protein